MKSFEVALDTSFGIGNVQIQSGSTNRLKCTGICIQGRTTISSEPRISIGKHWYNIC